MKYLATTFLMAVLFATPLMAQQEPTEAKPDEPRELMKPTVPAEAVSDNRRLSGAMKMAYVIRQVRLNDEQKEFARGLFATLYQENAQPQLDLAKVHSIVAEIQKAKEDGDEKLAAELGQQLRDMARNSDGDEEFLMNMETVLTDEQKVAMHAAYERLERNPSGALRPIDVIRAANELDLTTEQRASIQQTGQALREKMRNSRGSKLDDEWRFQTINAMIHSINQVLTEEQSRIFKSKIRGLRADIAVNTMTQQPPDNAQEDQD